MRTTMLLALALAACKTDGSKGAGPPVDPEPADACAAPESAPAEPLRRLSEAQAWWTVRDLVDATIPDADPGWVDWMLGDAWGPWLPADVATGAPGEPRGGYRRLDQDVHQIHVEGGIVAAQGLAVDVGLGTAWRASQLMEGTCDLESEVWGGDAPGACTEAWIRDMGLRTHRRPLTEQQVEAYVDVFEGAAADGADLEEWERVDLGFRHVLIAMLASPWAQYHVELPDEDGNLDAYALANRLSYHFWQSAPDAALYAAAADGSLLTDAGYRAQVERVVADDRTRRALAEFFADWLRTEEIPAMHSRVGTTAFEAFAMGFEPSADLHHAMADELVDLGLHHSLDAPGTFDALFLSDRMVSQDDELAGIYGVPAWDGTGTPPALGAERTGLLTRAGLLATGSANTRPIMKGVFVREGLLCDTIGTPPDNAAADAPELSDTLTTREVVEALTESEGTACAACHTGAINPLGFATEDFDALGRHRSTQPLFDEWGEQVAAPAVDTTGETVIAGQVVAFEDSFGLADAILASGDAHACFARESFRFAHGRAESATADTCAIDGLGQQLAAGMPLDEFLVEVAMLPQFRTLAAPAQ